MRIWLSLLFALAAGCTPPPSPPASPERGVQVFVPPGIEARGNRVPVLYVEAERALYFPQGVGGGGSRHPVVPSPAELLALGRRTDIIIVTVAPGQSTAYAAIAAP
ncbi:hypothetical protein [Myxococcus xanthus]|uniref:hypothetical protein n=1 Tax=Myxococcus xanthus TaxID=34 RepID=UPI00112CE025|nr:hypothetical protein [Myxococcus xanthus]QDF02768.1 hypothetical protein BHS04_05995 [Myxococcus xanthus]